MGTVAPRPPALLGMLGVGDGSLSPRPGTQQHSLQESCGRAPTDGLVIVRRNVAQARTEPANLAFASRLRFTQANTRSAAVFIDELDSGPLQSSSNDVKGSPSGGVSACFELADGDNAYPGLFCQFHLAPVNQAAGRSALRSGEHFTIL